MWDNRDKQDLKEIVVCLGILVCRVILASLVPRVHRDLKGLEVFLDLKEQLVRQGQQELKDQQDHKATLDNLDHQAILEHQGSKETRVQLVSREVLAFLDQLDLQVHRVIEGLWVLLVPWVKQEIKATQEILDHQEMWDLLDQLEIPDHLEQQDSLVNLVIEAHLDLWETPVRPVNQA